MNFAESLPSVTACLSMQPKSSAHVSFHALTISNSFLAGLPKTHIAKLQTNQTTQLISSPSLPNTIIIHLFSSSCTGFRSQKELTTNAPLSATLLSLSGTGPQYMSDLLHVYITSRQMRTFSAEKILHTTTNV